MKQRPERQRGEDATLLPGKMEEGAVDQGVSSS